MSSPIPKPPAPPVAPPGPGAPPAFGGNAALQQNYNSVAGFKMPAGGFGAPTDLQPPSPTGVPGWNPNAGGPISRPGGAPDFVPMGDDAPMGGDQVVGSPPSAFGMGGGMPRPGGLMPPMDKPMMDPMRARRDALGGMAGGNAWDPATGTNRPLGGAMGQSPGRQQLARLLMRSRRGGMR